MVYKGQVGVVETGRGRSVAEMSGRECRHIDARWTQQKTSEQGEERSSTTSVTVEWCLTF